MGEEKSLETLEVWRISQEFAAEICQRMLPRFPAKERFALSDQLRRSAQSIPANIAEAYGRFHYADAVRFCYIARGSLEETWSHILMSERLGYVSADELKEQRRRYRKIGRLLNGYIRFMKRQKRTVE